jgi:hypothetical protein
MATVVEGVETRGGNLCVVLSSLLCTTSEGEESEEPVA